MNEAQEQPEAVWTAQLALPLELPLATEAVQVSPETLAAEVAVSPAVAAIQASVAAMQQEVTELKAQLEATKQRESLPALVGNPAPASVARPLSGLALIRAAIAAE